MTKSNSNKSTNINRNSSRRSTKTSAFGTSSGGNDDGNFGDFFSGDLPQSRYLSWHCSSSLELARIFQLVASIERRSQSRFLNTGGMMSYVDTLTGGSISKLGIFSPYRAAHQLGIIFQLLSSVFPELQKLQKEEGESGRRQFMQYQR